MLYVVPLWTGACVLVPEGLKQWLTLAILTDCCLIEIHSYKFACIVQMFTMCLLLVLSISKISLLFFCMHAY